MESSGDVMKALIIGLLSFVVVSAIGGAAMTKYFLPSASPAFGASPATPAEQGEIPAKPFASRMSAENEISSDASRAGSIIPSSPSPSTAAPASSLAFAPKLEVSEHLDATSGGSSAELRFKDKVIEEKTAAAGVKKARGAARAEVRDGALASTVHYGVTNRSELMSRANGSVSNFKARGAKANAPVGKLAGDAGAKLADIQKQLDASPLPAEDRAKLKNELDPLSKDLEAAVKEDEAQ